MNAEVESMRQHDLAHCRRLLCGGSKSFHAASFLLPQRVRDPATALYAWCRVADDAVDFGGGAAALDELRRRLSLIYDGRPEDDPVDRAFADVVERFEMPRELPEALLEGMQWDIEGRRYESLEAVHAYGARVAGTVGAMMAVLMGVRSAEMMARATDLGVAMQLTNIARDVGEDARCGRVYLPLDWLAEAGIDVEAFLRVPRYSTALGTVVERLLKAADRLYGRADNGIDGLPLGCRLGIRAARLFYAEIGHELRRRGLDSVSQRTVVPSERKGVLAALAVTQATAHILLPHSEDPTPALAETAFLVDAVTQAMKEGGEMPVAAGRGSPVVRLLQVLERVERRERERLALGAVSE